MKTLKIISVFFILSFFSCSEENSIESNQNFNQEIDLQSKSTTPKPSNLPSKAPKSVVCNYFATNGNTPSSVASYCGFYWNGDYAPIPLSLLNEILAEPRSHTFNDLYILSPSSPTGIMPFNTYTLPDNLSIRSEIIAFYQKVYVIQLNQSITVTGSITKSEHIHKQAFVDTFFDWMFRMQASQPSSFNMLMNNNVIYRQLFNFFADYNLNEPASSGIYLGVFQGQNSTSPKLRCLTVVSEYLLTSNGSALLQSLNSGSISFESFKQQLNSMCY
ncbi:hypothetical protein [Flavobacterium sp.]|uniref:hypothetical protein n=1 Tax=Flavobacterium sp. TaxID=239 RepID=UPI0039E373FD